jgi:hypothetical protein
MDFPERWLINSLTQSLYEQQRAINSQLKETQKYEKKLIRRFNRRQKLQDNKQMSGTSVFMIQHQEEMDKLMTVRAQLKERLSIVEFKLAEINRR